MRRVVRPGGQVVAAVFGAAPASASKDAVDEVARDFGFRPPAWYVELKTRTEPLSNTPALLRGCAEAAGLEDIDVADITVDSGLDSPEAITAYRTGLAHVAPFVASLPAPRRTEFVDRAVAAVRERGQAAATAHPGALESRSRVGEKRCACGCVEMRRQPVALRSRKLVTRPRTRATRRVPP